MHTEEGFALPILPKGYLSFAKIHQHDTLKGTKERDATEHFPEVAKGTASVPVAVRHTPLGLGITAEKEEETRDSEVCRTVVSYARSSTLVSVVATMAVLLSILIPI